MTGEKVGGEKDNWREKYFKALDAHEMLEKSLTSQLELLRKALVRVSVAADGQHPSLDELLDQLRKQLRGGLSKAQDLQALEMLLAHLEKATISFERDQERAVVDVQVALSDMASALKTLTLSRSTHKQIGYYLAGLPTESQKIYLYPSLLRQLADLQEQALASLECKPKERFFSRLIGGGEPTHTDLSPSARVHKLPDESPEEPGTSGEYLAAAAPRRAPLMAVAPEVTTKITQVLKTFLVSLENENSIQAKVSVIRAKVEQGLASETLIPTLEVVRDLVMEAYLAANNAFATYLKTMNQELADIYELIGGAVEHSHTERAHTQQLQANLMRDMNSLEIQALEATDLKQLKDQVQLQLGSIRLAIDDHQQKDKTQNYLVEQLVVLSEKIKIMEREAEKNRDTLDVQRYKAMHDSLTDLPNREAYTQRVTEEIQRWRRYQRPLSLAIIDIDHFKKINDVYGHQAGDRAIKAIAQTIQKSLREVDFFCRYGGEEFVALLPETAGASALEALDKIRETISSSSFNYKEHHLSITFSVGLSEFKTGDSLESVFERADQALYTAKASGRNRCELAE
ncbi:MAG: GGDEF domain-containing protein [Marinagarivorans sp.]|nr:GGDEF domain-containing protein [Marinagarivorans sp.]